MYKRQLLTYAPLLFFSVVVTRAFYQALSHRRTAVISHAISRATMRPGLLFPNFLSKMWMNRLRFHWDRLLACADLKTWIQKQRSEIKALRTTLWRQGSENEALKIMPWTKALKTKLWKQNSESKALDTKLCKQGSVSYALSTGLCKQSCSMELCKQISVWRAPCTKLWEKSDGTG